MKKIPTLPTLVLRAVIPAALILLLAAPLGARGQGSEEHLVSPSAMQKRIADSAAERQQNIETITKFFATPVAKRAIKDAHFNSEQVHRAIPTLSDAELADLATRSADAQQKFAAGNLTKPELGVIVIALVVLVVVILVH